MQLFTVRTVGYYVLKGFKIHILSKAVFLGKCVVLSQFPVFYCFLKMVHI
jgi:hypothetical protein